MTSRPVLLVHALTTKNWQIRLLAFRRYRLLQIKPAFYGICRDITYKMNNTEDVKACYWLKGKDLCITMMREDKKKVQWNF